MYLCNCVIVLSCIGLNTTKCPVLPCSVFDLNSIRSTVQPASECIPATRRKEKKGHHSRRIIITTAV